MGAGRGPDNGRSEIASSVWIHADLIETLGRADARTLSLIVGPGGAGKTTLARAWRAEREAAGERVAWLSVAAYHRDPMLFVEDWVEAVREASVVGGGAGPFGTALIRSLPRIGEFDVDTAVALLVREYRALGQVVSIVVDGFEHLAPDGPAVAVLDGVLRSAPDSLHVVLTTRGFRPGAATRLVAEGRALEIDGESLRLPVESIPALAANAGVTLSRGEASSLHARTRGWAIGIHFAIRALGGLSAERRHAFFEELVEEPDLFRYIATEMVEGIDDAVLGVALCASLLGPVSRRILIDAIEEDGAAELVETAIDRGLIGNAITGLVVHDLLSDWLARHFECALGEEAWRALHARLGRVREAAGQPLEALRLYQAGGLVDEITAVLIEHGIGWVDHGLYDVVGSAFAELPEAALSNQPELNALAGVLESGRNPDRALECLERAMEIYRARGRRREELEILHWMGIIAANENRGDAVRKQYRHVLSLPRLVREPELRGLVALGLGHSCYLSQRFRAAIRFYRLAATYDHAPRERCGIVLGRTTILFYQGRWDDCIAEVDAHCADPRQREFGPGFFSTQIRRCVAVALRGEDIDGALETLAETSRFFSAVRQTMNQMRAEHGIGQIHARLGKFDAAIPSLAEAAALCDRIGMRHSHAGVLGALARAYQQAGRLDDAQNAASDSLAILARREVWEARLALKAFDGPGVALAGVVAAELGEAEAAWSLLARMRKRLVHRDLPLSASAVHLLMAYVAQRAGDRTAARRELTLAFRIRCEAGITDHAPEVDQALLDWGLAEARTLGLSTGAVASGTLEAPAFAGPGLAIRSLGGLSLEVGERSVRPREWRGKLTQRLFVRLLAADGRLVPRERIETDLWPDASPEKASNNLRVALSKLRDVLEPRRRRGDVSPFLDVEGDWIGLRPEAITSWDVEAWREAVGDVEAAAKARDEGRLATALNRLAATARGDFLPEAYDDWVLDLRRSLEERWAAVASESAALFLEADLGAAAVRIAERGVLDQRGDERAWRLLVTVRDRAGDRSGALRALADARDALAGELGLDPLSVLPDLAVAIGDD
ncbi:MAG: tetratricopeptide repeat protein [Myxococcota bacterium]